MATECVSDEPDENACTTGGVYALHRCSNIGLEVCERARLCGDELIVCVRLGLRGLSVSVDSWFGAGVLGFFWESCELLEEVRGVGTYDVM